MKKFLRFNKKFKRRVNTWLDRLSFINILIIWIGIILLFGVVYFFFTTDKTLLFSNLTNQPVGSMLDIVYFSFITATSTGFGDIVPLGAYKVISIFEVIFGLVLLAFVTSKLVSLKQNVILNEIYDISFNERINRLRSSLLLFRQNVNRLISRVEDNSVKRWEVREVYMYFSSLEDVLNEISTLLHKKNKSHFTKAIGPIDAELIFNSVVSSFKRTNELINTLNESSFDWRSDTNLSSIYKCINLNKEIFEKLENSQILPPKAVEEIKIRNQKMVESVKIEVASPEKAMGENKN